MSSHKLLSAVLGSGLLLFLPGSATAQSIIAGQVTDYTGGVLPGVYTVTFTLPGFGTQVRDQLALQADVTVSGEAPVVDVQQVQRVDRAAWHHTHRWSYAGSISYVTGSHNLKIGTNITRGQNRFSRQGNGHGYNLYTDAPHPPGRTIDLGPPAATIPPPSRTWSPACRAGRSGPRTSSSR